jgi:hypothetical protein
MIAAGPSTDVNAQHARRILSSGRRAWSPHSARVRVRARSHARRRCSRSARRRPRARRGVQSTRGDPGDSDGEPSRRNCHAGVRFRRLP